MLVADFVVQVVSPADLDDFLNLTRLVDLELRRSPAEYAGLSAEARCSPMTASPCRIARKPGNSSPS